MHRGKNKRFFAADEDGQKGGTVMEENTNWGQSVTGIVIRQGRVLLARHTYGAGKGMHRACAGQSDPQRAIPEADGGGIYAGRGGGEEAADASGGSTGNF